MPRPLVVLDTSNEPFQGNRIFDPTYAAKFPGATAIARLYEVVRQNGFEMITSDLYAEMQPTLSMAVCISDRVTPYVRRHLRDGRLKGAVLCNFESPNVDIDFYHTLRTRSALFKHAIVYRGMRDRVAAGTAFHTAYFPQASRTINYGPAWKNRDCLVMVVSNKQAAQSQGTATDLRHPLKRIKRQIRALQHHWIRLTDPLLRVRDLYRIRLEAAYYFSQGAGFRLYGVGWDRKIYGVPVTYDIALRKCLGGPVDDKIATMSHYRFALCFENCVFPGYVTEKIFDCFFAGCIPVYWGAPDISDFVPVETFVDARQFDSWMDLDRYLREMSDSEAQSYSNAARDFFPSDAFAKFHQDYFVTELFAILEAEFASGA